jgi:hypothetical protein
MLFRYLFWKFIGIIFFIDNQAVGGPFYKNFFLHKFVLYFESSNFRNTSLLEIATCATIKLINYRADQQSASDKGGTRTLASSCQKRSEML